MTKKATFKNRESVVIKFVGDSGDGMQLAGTLFSDTAAVFGNDLFTFPDYPAEIRAPHNTLAGVSGFQVQIGSEKIFSPGDLCDILVAMNPASLKTNLKWVRAGGIIVTDADAFNEKALEKSGYESNPLEDGSLDVYRLIKAPVSSMTRSSLSHLKVSARMAERSRNMMALGIVSFLLNQDLDATFKFLEDKFGSKQQVLELNKTALSAGYNFAETIEAIGTTYKVPKASLKKGTYRNISGNVATAWGFLAASERSGRPLFLGSYPITPATEILIELSQQKALGVKVFQAEDEIAGICSAIGASYTGSLAITTTSGPGLSLKSEAIGLAVMTELPLVIVNVQRAGPSTGMPTKSEQSDLLQALYGRNGECPVIIMAASTPANCFYYAYEAAKISMEHMTPVILLTDGYLGNGSELFRIPRVADLPPINPPLATANDENYKPYRRDPETLVRQWAIPGTEGLRHRIGGLEKTDIYGTVSTDPQNHQMMTGIREEKVMKVAEKIPPQKITGEETGDLLVVSWGGTEGSILTPVKALQKEGKKIGHAHFNHIMPLPKNTREVLQGYRKVIVCELNSGQFVKYLKTEFPEIKYLQYNKIQGLPFFTGELTELFNKLLETEQT
ncbi:MAG: 2-oxoacid:acceptor oxidoreductase subunit alpha [Marinilabiliales bacterium]|nr:MAG: 2-oxoacid:acceptor oxidoreductase subunit alpha [Marinilabiliales bacterium]